MTKPNDKPLMRSLGEFVGHIWRGLRTDVSREGGPARKVVRREVEERGGETADGQRVTLRRTTIEEVEVDRPTKGG